MAALAVLLIDPALLTFARLSFFLTGITTASPPSPKRENLGVGSVADIQFSLGSREIEGGRGWLDKPEADGRRPSGIGWFGKGGNRKADELARSSLVPRLCPYFIFRLAPASSRMAFRAHRGMVGIGGVVWLVLSVRTVRIDEVEARLVVEAEGKMKLARRRSAFCPSLCFSWVVDDDVETIDRRFARLERFFPSWASSLSLPFSLG